MRLVLRFSEPGCPKVPSANGNLNSSAILMEQPQLNLSKKHVAEMLSIFYRIPIGYQKITTPPTTCMLAVSQKNA